MPRYFMELSYNGAAFHGWQRQPNAVSVQQVLEECMARALRMDVPVTGAGRTDAGVHARRMTAHFDLPEPLGPEEEAGLVYRLNAMVGRDIAVDGVRRVAPEAHARFDARSRTYHYYCHTMKSPFVGSFSWQAKPDLDFAAMNEAASLLLGTHDFTSFAKLHSDARTNICTVTEARWQEISAGRWVFVITADRFLRNMVRAVVGTLVEVGRGKLSIGGMRRVMEAMDRCSAGTSMPAHALFLWDVAYGPEVEYLARFHCETEPQNLRE